MSNTGTPSGWYPDPGDAQRLRYWDGGQWTSHVHAPDPDLGRAVARAGNTRIASIVIGVVMWFPIGIFCGIAGVRLSKRARTAAERGDTTSATSLLNRARGWLILCAVVYTVWGVAFTLYFVLGGPS